MHTTTINESLELIERVETRDLVTVDIGYQPLLEREVVIKRLVASAAADPRLRGRFVKEIRALAALHHHNMVRVYDAGINDDAPYVVLEKLNGITIQQRLDQLIDLNMSMDTEEIAKIVRGVADVVEYSYQHGMAIHDMTPHNIILTTDRRVVLAGPGQALPDNPLKASTANIVYAAPEQVLNGTVDERSAVYSLGVLLSHLFFGRVPFEGSAVGIISQKQNGASLPILDNPYEELPCPYAMAHVMRQATARHASQRYASVEAFRVGLESALEGYPAKIQLMPMLDTDAREDEEDEIVGPSDPQQQVKIAEPVEKAPLRERTVGEPRTGNKASPRPRYVAPIVEEIPPDPDANEVHEDHSVARVPDTRALVPIAEMDPAMPGLENPALHAALAYTVLVPMESETPAAATPAAAAVPVAPGEKAFNYIHLIGLIMLGVMAVSAAMMFG